MGEEGGGKREEGGGRREEGGGRRENNRVRNRVSSYLFSQKCRDSRNKHTFAVG
jgi:hypothetical protein